MFEPENMEDEPCDSCGVKPSLHMGHGSFSCKACFDAWWCPKCHYDQRERGGKKHVCPTPEEIVERQRKSERCELLCGVEEAVEKIIVERDALKADVEKLKQELFWSVTDDGLLTVSEEAQMAKAHPMISDNHELYAKAMRLVSAKHSKFGLIKLVNWLLHCIEEKKS
jgi:hypothetical protein